MNSNVAGITSVPQFAAILGYDIDDAEKRVGTVNGGCRSVEHLHAFDAGNRKSPAEDGLVRPQVVVDVSVDHQ